MSKLTITPKGKKYIEERKAKSPEMAALCKKIQEDVLPNLPTSREAMIKAVYDAVAIEHVKEKELRQQEKKEP